jgi:predicted nucleic acid-binding protein
MITDTNFLIDLHQEQSRRQFGRACAFLAQVRKSPIRTTIISAGEFAAGFILLEDARAFLARIPIIRLTPESAYEAARIDRELMDYGGRLGENDNWIAGIARYYGETVISNDRAFNRVRGLRVRTY